MLHKQHIETNKSRLEACKNICDIYEGVGETCTILQHNYTPFQNLEILSNVVILANLITGEEEESAHDVILRVNQQGVKALLTITSIHFHFIHCYSYHCCFLSSIYSIFNQIVCSSIFPP